MARATTKGDLITSANGQFDKMWKLIDSMSEERQKAAFADEMATAGKETHWSRDRNLRDVLVYLYEWHQLLLRWIKAKLDGGYKTVLPEPYNWNTYPASARFRWSSKTRRSSFSPSLKTGMSPPLSPTWAGSASRRV